MLRIIFNDLREVIFWIALVVGFCITVVVMSSMFPLYSGRWGGIGVSDEFLVLGPVLVYVLLSEQPNKKSRIATLASLPIAAHILSLSRYGAAIAVQVGSAAIFLSIGALTRFTRFDGGEGVFFSLNCAFLGLGLFAIGLLIVDFSPSSAPAAIWMMGLSGCFFLLAKVSDWPWNRFGDPQVFMLVAAIVLVMVGTEVYVFCRRSSLA